ncbi:DUF2071 domain-containing protein [bacterium]|nr:DUF2071 domain-containing protein [bacterium]
MNWLDLCFLHWPVRVADLRPFIPPALEVDSYDGWAWLALVPFTMSGVKPIGWPDLPGVSAFPEFNVRTYVRDRAVSGVWFFSLDAGQRLAVRIARRFFHLPYFDATFERSWQQGWCHYFVRRTHFRAPAVHFQGRFRPVGEVFHSQSGSLEEFLTERYWLFSQHPDGRVFRARVFHERWPLQAAEIDLDHFSMEAPLGLRLLGPPKSQLFSARIKTSAQLLEPAEL